MFVIMRIFKNLPLYIIHTYTQKQCLEENKCPLDNNVGSSDNMYNVY